MTEPASQITPNRSRRLATSVAALRSLIPTLPIWSGVPLVPALSPPARVAPTHGIYHLLTGLSLGQAANVAQIVIAVVALVGILPALVQLIRQRDKERRDRLADAYSGMGDRWSDFLKLCLDHPDLGLAALGLRDDGKLSPKKLYLYSALIQLINRAYVLYRDEPEDVKRDRYTGWEEYLDDLLGLDEFIAAWKLIGFGYDKSFFQYVNRRIRQLENAAGDSGGPSALGDSAHDQPEGEVPVQQPVAGTSEDRGPVVTDVTPNSGPQAGNTVITITGRNLSDAEEVEFDSRPATSVQVRSPTSISAKSPAGSGTVDVIVTTPHGRSVSTDRSRFTYTQAPPGESHSSRLRRLWSVALAIVVGVAVVLLALIASFISTSAKSLGLHALQFGAGVFLLLSLGFVVAAVKQPERRDRWVAGAVLNAVLGVALAIGAGAAKDRFAPPKPDCAALYSQLVEIVIHEKPAVAEEAAGSDPRNSACHEPLKVIRNEALHEPPDVDIQPQQPRTDCLQFFVLLDELVDDEPIAIAKSVIEHDPRKDECKAPLTLLAHE
jgi:hypothetical protein